MKKIITSLIVSLGLCVSVSHATIVEFQTSHGNFKVNLHDETTPLTVENFLSYVNAGKYDNTIVHRTVDDFIVQGGGAKYEGKLPPTWIETEAEIKNEPVYSNVTATISMAKSRGNLHSATSQWFINTKNNSSDLDAIDIYGGGAYTVFGEVIDDGMDVINIIAAVERCDTLHSGFRELPMPDYQEQCKDSNAVPGQENFVTVYQVVIYDSTVTTNENLAKVRNTRYSTDTDSGTDAPSSSSGGGSMIWLTLLLSICIFSRCKK